jgi:hypothetical protein
MIAAGVGFVATASKTYVPATVLADLDLNTAAAEVKYLAERDTGKPAATRGRWRVVEDTTTGSGPRKEDPVLTLRRVFVHSSARAHAATMARAKKLDRAREDPSPATRPPCGRPRPTTMINKSGIPGHIPPSTMCETPG